MVVKFKKLNELATIPTKAYPDDAGYKRNAEIWQYADEGIAFWNGVSQGTKHSLDLSKFYGKKLNLIKF
jgi:hypothetical protein